MHKYVLYSIDHLNRYSAIQCKFGTFLYVCQTSPAIQYVVQFSDSKVFSYYILQFKTSRRFKFV
jgi:hypothetical protein